MDTTINLPQSPARVSVPAWTTVEYFDKAFNLIAKYDAARPFAKDCLFNHPNEAGPFKAVLTKINPDEAHVDADSFPEGI